MYGQGPNGPFSFKGLTIISRIYSMIRARKEIGFIYLPITVSSNPVHLARAVCSPDHVPVNQSNAGSGSPGLGSLAESPGRRSTACSQVISSNVWVPWVWSADRAGLEDQEPWLCRCSHHAFQRPSLRLHTDVGS